MDVPQPHAGAALPGAPPGTGWGLSGLGVGVGWMMVFLMVFIPSHSESGINEPISKAKYGCTKFLVVEE